MDRPKAIEHSDNCDWHLDQYDFECTCGKSAAYLYSVNQKLRADRGRLIELSSKLTKLLLLCVDAIEDIEITATAERALVTKIRSTIKDQSND